MRPIVDLQRDWIAPGRRFFGASVPYVELLPGNWHWRGFTGEMMTQPPSGPITTISVGALMDIGYPAAWYGADR